MAKLLLILLIGLVFESTGVVLLKKGITQVGEVKTVSAAEIVRVVKAGVTNPSILLGVFFEALFFACLLVLLAESDISFLWPLTALSFVLTTFAALMFLQRAGLRRPLGRRGVHHDRRRADQLQRARQAEAIAACRLCGLGNYAAVISGQDLAPAFRPPL